MKKPKILIYDVESTPNLGYVWGKYEQNVLAYEKERELLSIAYKWVGDKSVRCLTRRWQTSDKELTKDAADLLQEADVTVAHNGDQFDRKVIKTRMLYWKMSPLKVNCSVDTLKAAKLYFHFNGNSLSDLAKFLKLGVKTSPGIDMWLGCMKGDAKSWRTLIKYNEHDVVLLEKIYEKLLPWIENAPNMYRLRNPLQVALGCPSCSSYKLIKAGLRPTVAGIQQRWVCYSCTKQFTTRLGKR